MTIASPSRVEVVVRWTAPGFHRWPDAPNDRAYLGVSHRHLFHYEVRLDTAHLDLSERQLEFHDVLVFFRLHTYFDWNTWSCEQVAAHLAQLGVTRFGVPCTVSVFEDGEVGAIVAIPAPVTP